MSLTVAFKSAQLGLQQAEKKIAVAASNINNADRAGYTRKTLISDYITNGLASLPAGGRVVQAVFNPLLVKQVVLSATAAAGQKLTSTYLSNYGQAFGTTTSDATNIETSIDTLLSTLHVLEANPGDHAAKSKVVSTAQLVTTTLNTLSRTVQSERLRANNDIGAAVVAINENLASIAELNRQISAADAGGYSTGDLEDERNVALQTLSQKVGIQYFVNGNNQAMVFTSGGSALVSGSGYAAFAYEPVGVVTSGTVYPGGFPPITLNGNDVTTSITTGEIGALIALRDSKLVNEQAKLDALADKLKTTVNHVLNQGTAYPPLATITGTEVVTAGTAFVGTGNLRIAVTDSTGLLVNYQDINIGGTPTVGALVAALNGVPGVNATINAQGYLEVNASAAGTRISFNPLNTVVGTQNATEFFGFNNLFTYPTTNTGATGINVNSNLISNYDALAVGTLNPGVMVAGDHAITSGDVSNTRLLIDIMKAPQLFAAAGNFSSRDSTLSNYAGAIISDIATQASAAKNAADTSSATFTYLSNNLSNETGVNIDEETANLTVLQTAYQANAQVINTVKTLFDTLINSIR